MTDRVHIDIGLVHPRCRDDRVVCGRRRALHRFGDRRDRPLRRRSEDPVGGPRLHRAAARTSSRPTARCYSRCWPAYTHGPEPSRAARALNDGAPAPTSSCRECVSKPGGSRASSRQSLESRRAGWSNGCTSWLERAQRDEYVRPPQPRHRARARRATDDSLRTRTGAFTCSLRSTAPPGTAVQLHVSG